LFLTYDENDGFFDHMMPPTAPPSRKQGKSNVDTTNEIFPGNKLFPSGPYGLGVRVPMIVISPWSKGGWVNSQVFDHTSLLRFMERRFKAYVPDIHETNITAWRRAVAGDLTSAFDFATPNSAAVRLPGTTAYRPPNRDKYPDYSPTPPLTQSLPRQEPGMRPARALPYAVDVWRELDAASGSVKIRFENSGEAAAVFQVRAVQGDAGPWTYTVGPRSALVDEWISPAVDPEAYALSVHGPNGFLRTFRGAASSGHATTLDIRSLYDMAGCGITLRIRNAADVSCRLRIRNGYLNETTTHALAADETLEKYCSLASHFGWYDFTVTVESNLVFEQRVAGHVETGKDSMSDPLMGQA